MNRVENVLILVVLVLFFTQCGVFRGVTKPETEPETEAIADDFTGLVGMAGLEEMCRGRDTISSIVIRKAEALFITSEQRYEAVVSIYSIKDSLIYMSAVNSGFEIIRATISMDSIKVIDRINKIVYNSVVKKKFGHQNPINFNDVQNLISRYYLCDNIDDARELNFSHIDFHFDEPGIKKNILLEREGLNMHKFEFVSTKTGKYFMGEKGGDDFRIYSNFIINDFEISAKGGEVSYNQIVEVKMDVNKRKYSFVNY